MALIDTPPPIPPAARASWRQKHPGQFGALIGIGALVAVVGVILGFASLVFGFMKSSDAYTGALARARSAPAVTAALGTPIKEAWFLTGNIEVKNSTGRAELAIPISGPRDSGTLYVRATKQSGEWQFDRLMVQIKRTGEKIDLTPSQPKPPAPH